MHLGEIYLQKLYGTLPYEDYALISRAVRTLIANTEEFRRNDLPWLPLRGIQPSYIAFPGVWNWDCAFHAMGVVRWDAELAKDQIRIFMKLQAEDGMYPDVWGKEDKSVFWGCSKPPIMPWAAWVIDQYDSDEAFLRETYTSFLKNEKFWSQKRGGDTYGLFHYDGNSEDPEKRKQFGGFESGWDDSPRWDGGILNIFPVDLNCYMILFYRVLSYIAKKLNLHEEADLWSKKELCLTDSVEKTFWNEEKKCYFDYDHENKTFGATITPACFMPLFIKTATAERAAAMAEIAAENLRPGWPSVSYKDPAYDPVGYWRGRTWLNIAYFALKGLKNYGITDLAEEGRSTILDWVRRDPGIIYENYNSATGRPAGAPCFSWSSVFCIKFLQDWECDCDIP